MTSLSHATEQYLDRLRPRCFDELIGQPRLTDRLCQLVERARRGDQRFPPVVLEGQPQVGKRAIASAMAFELAEGDESSVRFVFASALDDESDQLCARFEQVGGGDVVVVEEIQHLEAVFVKKLPQLAAGYGCDAEVPPADNGTHRIGEPPAEFSLLATASPGLSGGVSGGWNPLEVRDYNTEELIRIAHWCAQRLDIQLTETAAFRLARESRGYAHRLKIILVEVFLESVEALSQKNSWLIEEWMVEEVVG